MSLYRQALKFDPNYAYVWGLLSLIQVNMGTYLLSGNARQEAFAQAMAAVDKQQMLAPNAAATQVNRGYLLSVVNNDAVGALGEFKRAYALAPNNGDVMNFLSGGFQLVGELQPAAELMRKALESDPLRADWYASLAQVLLGQRQFDAAEQAVRQALILQPDYPGMYTTKAEIAMLRGDIAAAQRYANLETDPTERPWTMALVQQVGPDRRRADEALRGYLSKNGEAQPYSIATLYAARAQPDAMFEWLQRAWAQHDPAFAGLLSDPLVLAYRKDPRFAALCKQARLPFPAAIAPMPAVTSHAGQGAGTYTRL
jgi:serine/threonine-protein kinase